MAAQKDGRFRRARFLLGISLLNVALFPAWLVAEDESLPELIRRWEAAKVKYEAAARTGNGETILSAVEERIAIDRRLLATGKIGEANLQPLREDLSYFLSEAAEIHERRGAWDSARQVLKDLLELEVLRFGKADWRVTDARWAVKALDIRQKLSASERRELAQAELLNKQVFELFQQGKAEEALPLAMRSVAIRRRVLGETHPDYAAALFNLSAQYQQAGRMQEAEAPTRQAVAVHQRVYGENHPSYAMSLHNLASLYRLMGDYGEAEKLFRRAIGVHERASDANRAFLAASLNNLAVLFDELGDYSKAEPLYRRAVEIWTGSHGEHHPNVAAGLVSLANLYRSMGDFARAEPLTRKAIEIQRQSLGEDHPKFAISLLTLASIEGSRGESSQAEATYRRACKILKDRLGVEHPDYAHALHQLAYFYAEQGKFSQAEPLFQQAIAIRKAALGQEHPAYLESLDNLAMVDMSQRKYVEAESHYRQVIQVHEEALGGRHPGFSDALYHLASLYYLMGKDEEAARLIHRALEVHLRQAVPVIRAQSEFVALRFLSTTFRDPALAFSLFPSLPERETRVGYELMWNCRGLVGAVLAQRRDAVFEAQGPRLLHEKLRRTSRQLAQLTLATVTREEQQRRQTRLRELNVQKEELERQLAAASQDFRHDLALSDSGPGDLIALLPEDTAIVDFVQHAVLQREELSQGRTKYQFAYEAFVLRKSDQEPGYRLARVRLKDADQIDSAVERWLALINRESTASDDVVQLDRMGRNLRQRLWEPLEPHLSGVQHVVIIPDAALHFVPWVALPGRREETFLLEDYTLTSTPSGRLLHQQLSEGSEGSPAQGGLLAIGGVDYDVRPESSPAQRDENLRVLAADLASGWRKGPPIARRGKWGFLEGTASEADAVVRAWPEAAAPVRLSGTGASEAALLNYLPGRKYIHLSTHGFFADAEFRSVLQHDLKSERLFDGLANGPHAREATVTGRNPLILSGLVLAGANLPPVRDANGLPSGEDGILTAQEVVQLDLRGAELVTLSACDTGRGADAAGREGIYGLQRAFHLAGAKHVVASLWKVDDQATTALMKLFYHYLWQEKQSPATSLRNAQLFLLTHPEAIATIAESTDRGLGRKSELLKSRPSAKSVRTPIRLWAAFTHSGPPM